MGRWQDAAVIGAVLTVLSLLAVGGQYPGEGPVLFSFSRTHGVHAGDLVVAAVWAVCIVLLVGLARRPPPGRG